MTNDVISVCVLPFVLVREQLSTWLLGPTTTQAEQGGPGSWRPDRFGSDRRDGASVRFCPTPAWPVTRWKQPEQQARTRACHVMLFQPPS